MLDARLALWLRRQPWILPVEFALFGSVRSGVLQHVAPAGSTGHPVLVQWQLAAGRAKLVTDLGTGCARSPAGSFRLFLSRVFLLGIFSRVSRRLTPLCRSVPRGVT